MKSGSKKFYIFSIIIIAILSVFLFVGFKKNKEEISNYQEQSEQLKEQKKVMELSEVNEQENNLFSDNQDSILYNKKIAYNGDSICYGAGYAGGFPKIIGDMFDMIVDNQAVSGATVADLTSRYPDKHSIVLTVGNMVADADYVIFEGGYNDWYLWTQIGSITDTMTSELDITTFYGAIESTCRQAKDSWPETKIGWIITHKINDAYEKSQQEGNLNYPSLSGYYQAIMDVCEKYEIPYLDLSNNGLDTGISKNAEMYTYNSDGIHPNELGYEIFYIPQIVEFLEGL